ncbi:MAG: hypothetical protein HY720_25960 [Planctomycetes bacterium]|nr:hypothetical protein [Planctomycetota bacterium]
MSLQNSKAGRTAPDDEPHPEYPALSRAEVAALLDAIGDHSHSENWRRFNEISRQFEIEDSLAMSPEERLLSCLWYSGEDETAPAPSSPPSRGPA